MLNFIDKTFSSFKYKNFRLFFIGQSVSLIGTWMQQTAMSWLVYEMTGSKYLLGLIAALGMFPMLFLSLFGGVIADKYSKRKTLIVTQFLSMILAFVLGWLAISGNIQVFHLKILALLTGIVFAVDLPVKHAFYVELVDKKDLMNAIALNSSMVNLAKVLGPVFAGLIMLKFGLEWCFMINAFSFLAVLLSLFKIKSRKVIVEEKTKSVLKSIEKGFRYIRDNKLILNLIILMTAVCLFGWSYIVLIPAIAKDFYGVGEKGYTVLMAANGLGALIGALVIAYLGNSYLKRSIVNWGVYLFSFSLILMAYCKIYWISLILMGFMGFGLIAYFSASSGLIQSSADDKMRGRVMGVWALVFGGVQPIGCLFIGTVAENIGISLTLVICSLMCLFSVLTIKIFQQPKEMELQKVIS